MKRWIAVCAAALVGACQTAVEVPPGTSDPAKFDEATLAAAKTVKIVNSSPADAKLIGKVEAHACQRLQWEPDPSEDTALILLKAEAARRGANALSNVSFRRANMSVSNNCYGIRYADGDAYRIER